MNLLMETESFKMTSSLLSQRKNESRICFCWIKISFIPNLAIGLITQWQMCPEIDKRKHYKVLQFFPNLWTKTNPEFDT